jgi:hypothetical protein
MMDKKLTEEQIKKLLEARRVIDEVLSGTPVEKNYHPSAMSVVATGVMVAIVGYIGISHSLPVVSTVQNASEKFVAATHGAGEYAYASVGRGGDRIARSIEKSLSFIEKAEVTRHKRGRSNVAAVLASQKRIQLAQSTTPNQNSSASIQQASSIDLSSLKSDLQSFILSNIPAPRVVYESTRVVETVQPIIYQTVTRQSDADSGRRTTLVNNITKNYTFTNSTLNNATVSGTGDFSALTALTLSAASFTATNSTTTNATTTNLAVTNLCISGTCNSAWPAGYTDTDANLFIHSSTTIPKLYTANTWTAAQIFDSILRSTTTQATTTSLYFSSSLTGGGHLTLEAQKELRLSDADSSNYVAFKSPSVVGSNVTWTLPSADASGCLKSNGAGLISIDTCGDSAVSAGGLTNDFRGLQLRTVSGSDSVKKVVLIHADEIVTKDGARHTPANNLEADISTSGIGGLRSGQTEAASTWYKIMYAYGASGEGIYLEQAKDYFLDESQTTTDTNYNLRDTSDVQTKLAQTFDTDVTGTVEFVDLKFLKTGTPTGNFWLSIYATSAGVPTGSALKTSDKIDVSLITTTAGGQWVRLVFRDPATLTAGTTYALVLEGDYTASGSNFVRWYANTNGASYGAGTVYKQNNGVWTLIDDDFTFKVYVTENDNTPTPPSGYNTSYAHIGWVYNDSGSNFMPFLARDRKVVSLQTNSLGGISSTVPALTDASSAVPPTPLVISIIPGGTGTAADTMYMGGVPDGYYIDALRTNGGLRTGYGTSQFANSYPPVDIYTEYQGVYLQVSANSATFFRSGYEWYASNIGTPASAADTGPWLMNDTNQIYYNTANVGIGTSTPWAKLSIKGSGTGTGAGFVFADSSNAPKFTILDNGNVGIGTTTPGALLSISGNSAEQLRLTPSASGVTAIAMYDGGGSVNARGWGFRTNVEDWGSFKLYESSSQGSDPLSGTARLTVLSGGNVGIGDTAPDNTLTVAGAASFTGNVTIGSAVAPVNVAGMNRFLEITTGAGSNPGIALKAGSTGNAIYTADTGSFTFWNSVANGPVLSLAGNGQATFTANNNNSFAVIAFNDGNTSTRGGLLTQSGADDASGTNVAIRISDGDQTTQGDITFTSGTVTYGAFTANHDVKLPESDNGAGYPYGTLVCIENIYLKNNLERGIEYNVEKCSGSYANNVLGAYAGKRTDEANLHQVYILGDGHILVNGENGNIKIGDPIVTSSTEGVGMKGTDIGIAIGIAQEDYEFSSQEETKLIAVQYGISEVNPARFASDEDFDFSLTSYFSIIWNAIVSKMADTANGINSIVANVFNAKERICVDGECLTKDDIRALLTLINSSSTGSSGNQIEENNSSEEETASTTEETIEEPTEEVESSEDTASTTEETTP